MFIDVIGSAISLYDQGEILGETLDSYLTIC